MGNKNISRRDFLVGAATTALATTVGGAPMGAVSAAGPRNVEEDKAVTRGEKRYEAVVPDTLDLAERAALSVNALTGAADYKNGYETFQCGHLDWQPNYMSRRFGGPCFQKPVEALPMMRVASGSAQNADVDEKMADFIVNNIDKDGLWWLRAEGRPWQAKTLGGDQVWPVAQGRLISAMLVWHRYTGDDKWLRVAERLVGGLTKIALVNGDRAWFGAKHTPGGWGGDNTPSAAVTGASSERPVLTEPPHVTPYDAALPLRGYSEWYALTGDKKALEMAHKVAAFFFKDTMWRSPYDRERGVWYAHFHTFTMCLMGILEYAIAAQDAKLLRFVANAYENGRPNGIPRIGFFEAVRGGKEPGENGISDEGCAVADMLCLAVRLSEIGVGDYWEDADMYLRNQLIEHQMVDRGLMRQLLSTERESAAEYTIDPMMDETENVLERNVGSFASGTDPTWLYGWWTMCCNANCAVGLYKGWEAIIREADGVAQVNLLLNRASAWLDIDSYLPYEGKVVLRNKSVRKAHVRIPSMADKRAVCCRINGKQIANQWLTQYLVIEPLRRNDVVTIEFPMVETRETCTENTYPKQYIGDFKFNTLVDISPRGERPVLGNMGSDDGASFKVVRGYPIYRRDNYKADKAPMKKVVRYASKVIV
ncbi:MAG: hypothetical protein HYX78_01060 [Armatimonadetes bacterium]|nr:hypothetical protein [Armatimonadota bacterium]